MPAFARIAVHLSRELFSKLTEQSSKQGVSAKTYAEVVLSQALFVPLRADLPQSQEARPLGRPILPENDDLSSRIERAETASGFMGIYARGKRWTARWMYEELGLFSSPEMAAIARYWFEQGRRSVARDTLIASGTPRDEAVRLSCFKGSGEPLVIPEVAGAPGMPTPPVKRPRGRPRKHPVGPIRVAPGVVIDAGAVIDAASQLPDPAFTAVRGATHSPDLEAEPSGDPKQAGEATPGPLSGGDPSDTTNDGPPEAIGADTGGKGPSASGAILRWSSDFRQVAASDGDDPAQGGTHGG